MFNCSLFKVLKQQLHCLSLALLCPIFKVLVCILKNKVQTKESLDQSSVSNKNMLLAVSGMNLSFQMHHWVRLHLHRFWGNNSQLCLKFVADVSGNLKPSLGPRQPHVLRAVQWSQVLALRQALKIPKVNYFSYMAGISVLPPKKKKKSIAFKSRAVRLQGWKCITQQSVRTSTSGLCSCEAISAWGTQAAHSMWRQRCLSTWCLQ